MDICAHEGKTCAHLQLVILIRMCIVAIEGLLVAHLEQYNVISTRHEYKDIGL
jgi:hypothetical protein